MTRLAEMKDEDLLKMLEDDRVAQVLHQRLFMLRYSLSEREMHLQDQVMELKKKLDLNGIDY